MATPDDIREAVLRHIKQEYLDEGHVEVDYDTPLMSGGIVDSFSMVSLKRFLERTYRIQIPNAKATPDAFDSVNRIAALVKESAG